MVNSTLLRELAARVLDVPVDADEDMVSEAFREKSSSWHPDVSDEPDAMQKFIAAQSARDVLLGNIKFSNADKTRSAKDNLSALFDESEIDDIDESTSKDVGYRSSAETRTDPSQYTQRDVAGASSGEKREMMKEIALGVETTIIFQAAQGLYEQGYEEGDFFDDVNSYIEEARADSIDFGDYYQATWESLRNEVTEELFLNSCEKIQETLQTEYGEGTNIREVARIMAHFMVQGGIDIGDAGRFVGRADMGGDERFTRGHPLGRHGRGRRRDSRYTRGSNRYERR